MPRPACPMLRRRRACRVADLPVSDAVLFPGPGPAAIIVPATVEGAAPLAAAGDRQPANPPLAMGLSGIADWSTEQPFIDVMKSARPWTGHLPGQWGGWTHDDLAARGWLDAHGWPTAVPGELTGISTILLSDQPEAAASLAGRYRLTYRGQGRIRIEGRASGVVARAGEIWFEYTPGPGQVVLTIASTDPHKTGDHIRDIEIIKAENIELHAAGAVFNPLWRARVEDLRAVRFMDWMATNNSTPVGVGGPAAAHRLHIRLAWGADRDNGGARERDRRRPVVHAAPPGERRLHAGLRQPESATASTPGAKSLWSTPTKFGTGSSGRRIGRGHSRRRAGARPRAAMPGCSSPECGPRAWPRSGPRRSGRTATG